MTTDLNVTDINKPPLFATWSGLSEPDKSKLINRLAKEKDPFRQSLLDSMLQLDADELLMAYEDGFEVYSWKMMSLVIQAMPDDVMNGLGQRKRMLKELRYAFRSYEALRADEVEVNINEDYPYFYAEAKLQSGHSCWHSIAITNAELAIHSKQHKNYDFHHIGYYAAVMLNYKISNKDEDIVKFAINSAQELHSRGLDFDSSLDSYFHGFDLIKDNNRLDTIVSALVDKDKIADVIAMMFVSEPISIASFYLASTNFVLSLIKYAGIENFTKRLLLHLQARGDGGEVWLKESFVEIFSLKDIACNDVQYMPVLRGICEFQINNLRTLSGYMINYTQLSDHLIKDSGFLSIYTERKTIEDLFDLSFSEITNLAKKEWPDDYMDRVANGVKNGWISILLRNHSIGSFAVRCLVLSGTRYPDLFETLTKETRQYLVSEMDKLSVQVDSRALIKLNILDKESTFERDLGL